LAATETTTDITGFLLEPTGSPTRWELYQVEPAADGLPVRVAILEEVATRPLPEPQRLAVELNPKLFREYGRSVAVGRVTEPQGGTAYLVGIWARPVVQRKGSTQRRPLFLSVESLQTEAAAIAEAERISQMYPDEGEGVDAAFTCEYCEDQYRWCLIYAGFNFTSCLANAETFGGEYLCGLKYELDLARCVYQVDACLSFCGPF
jgi:hypothetical protein